MTTHRQAYPRRWRNNPLCRRSDVLDLWIRRVTGYVLVVGTALTGVGAGVSAHDAARTTADTQQAQREPVTARLLADSPPAGAVSDGAGDARYTVPVRWTTSDGTHRTGTATVPAGADQGSETRIWLNRSGHPVGAPLGDIDIWLRTVLTGGAAAGAASAAVYAVRTGAGRAIDRHRMAEWDQEWARVGPEWGGYSSRA